MKETKFYFILLVMCGLVTNCTSNIDTTMPENPSNPTPNDSTQDSIRANVLISYFELADSLLGQNGYQVMDSLEFFGWETNSKSAIRYFDDYYVTISVESHHDIYHEDYDSIYAVSIFLTKNQSDIRVFDINSWVELFTFVGSSHVFSNGSVADFYSYGSEGYREVSGNSYSDFQNDMTNMVTYCSHWLVYWETSDNASIFINGRNEKDDEFCQISLIQNY